MRRILLINSHRTIEIRISLFGRVQYEILNQEKMKGRRYDALVVDEEFK